MAPKHSAGVLCGVSRGKRLCCALQRSYRCWVSFLQAQVVVPAGHEFNVNELTVSAYEIVYVKRNKVIHQLTKMLRPEACKILTQFSLGAMVQY